MKKLIRVSFVRVWSLGVLVAACLSCVSKTSEIPITTSSPEARKLFIQGRELYENLREDEARDLFYQAIEKDQDFALCHYYLADAAASAVDYHTHLVLAVQLSSKVSDGERLLIESLRAQAENNPVKAREKLEELVRLYPRDKRAHRLLGYLYRGVDEDKAIAEYKRAIEIDEKYAPAYNNLGYAYQRKGEYDKAIEAFKKYSELLPDEANPHDSIAELYKKMGRYEESIKHYRKALELKPTFAFSQRNIGENLIFMGNYEEARYMFEEVQKSDAPPQKKLDALQMLAHSYIYEGRYHDALDAFDRALAFATTPNLPEWQATLYLDKALLYIETGRLDEARKCVEQCESAVAEANFSQADKQNFMEEALVRKAQIAAKERDYDMAFTLAEELKSLIDAGNDPQEMEKYHNLLGFIYASEGYNATAIEHFKKANTKSPYALYLWAQCESRRGSPEKSHELMQQIMNLNESSIDYAFVRPRVAEELQSSTLTQKAN